jgi:hypothetical protein
MQKHTEKIIVGLHDNNSIEQLKNISDIDSYDNRKKNLEKYAYDVFKIDDVDPTKSIQEYISINFSEADENNLLIDKNWCFMRGNDNEYFPSIEYIKSIMSIQYLPYSNEISATKLRDFKNKLGVMNYLLRKVVDIMDENNIPYYLDCGTLLGCVRENGLMEKDTDIDVTIHLSNWDKLKSIDFNKYELQQTRILNGFPKKEDGNMISVKTKYSKLYCDIYTNPAFPQLDNKILNGKSYNIPLNSELYLTQLYGNWTIPSRKHANTKYHRGNGLVNSEYFNFWDTEFEIFKCNM